MYSFTKPKKKPLFKEDTKLWLVFIFVSFMLYAFFSVFLVVKSYIFKREISQYQEKIANLKKKTLQLENEKNFIYKEKALYENITIKNDLVKQQIKNLLDLIPDPITLQKFYIDNNKLIIYGITPTKDVYNLLMLPPLESIFSQTTTTFYQLPNGWYRFKSVNLIKGNDEIQAY